MAYGISGVLLQKTFEAELKKAGKVPTTYNPPDFAPEYRDLFANLLKPIAYKPAVETDNYLVEANLLEGPKGKVITLSNWTGKPLQGVRVTLRTTAKIGKPFSSPNPIKAQSAKPGILQFTLDLGPADFIVVPLQR